MKLNAVNARFSTLFITSLSFLGEARDTKPNAKCFLSLHEHGAPPMIQMHHVLYIWYNQYPLKYCTRVVCKFAVNWIENHLVYGLCVRERPSLDVRR